MGGEDMKKVYVFVFDSESELLRGSEIITEQFVNLDNSKVYCGAWGEITSNRMECLESISSFVNHFIQMQEKKEIFFGCNVKDVLDIKPLLALGNCKLLEVPYCEFIKDF